MSPEKGEATALPHHCDPVVGFDFYEYPERAPHPRRRDSDVCTHLLKAHQSLNPASKWAFSNKQWDFTISLFLILPVRGERFD